MNLNHQRNRMFTYADIYKSTRSSLSMDFIAIKNFLSTCPEGPIADFGAGVGRLLDADLDRDILLIENDPDMLSHLAEKAKTHERATIIPQSTHNCQIADNSVAAAIFAYGGLAEMRPIGFALGETFRILQPGGKIFAVMLNSELPVKRASPLSPGMHENTPISTHAMTIRAPDLGPFEYFTQLRTSSEKSARVFLVRQTIPPISELTRLLENIGFTDVFISCGTTGATFDSTKSSVYNVEARKPTQSVVPRIQETLQNIYNKMAPSYNQVMDHAQYRALDWVKKEVASMRDTFPTILDFGCGNGAIVSALNDLGIRGQAFGIDFSNGMIAEAQNTGLYDGLLQYDLSFGNPIVEGAQFDLITAIGITEFLPNAREFMTSIRLNLVAGGCALVTFELSRPGIPESGSTIDPLNIKKYHYTTSQIESIAKDAGFRVDSLSTGIAYHSPSLGCDVPYIFGKFTRVGVP